MSRKDHPIAAIRAANQHNPQFNATTHANQQMADAAEWEAELANLGAKADRLRELTAPAPTTEGMEVTEIETIDLSATPLPFEPKYGTTADGRIALSILEHHLLNNDLAEMLQMLGSLTTEVAELADMSRQALEDGEYLRAATFAILASRAA